MRLLGAVLALQILLAGTLIVLVATDNVPFVGGDDSTAETSSVPVARTDRFDGRAAFALAREQVELGPRPAGSAASRRLAERIRRTLPDGRFQAVPGGLRNVIGVLPGRDRSRTVVVGAHYDTKELPGFVGAVDGASGTAILMQLARTLRPRQADATLVFVAFDGEEAPPGRDAQFERFGLRGSKVAARALRGADAMVLLDFVGQRGLRIPREQNSDRALWRELRAAARRVGVQRVFPDATRGPIADDHLPFLRAGVPAIDLIDFDYACFHRRCDDLSQLSERSMDAVGETMVELLPKL